MEKLNACYRIQVAYSVESQLDAEVEDGDGEKGERGGGRGDEEKMEKKKEAGKGKLRSGEVGGRREGKKKTREPTKKTIQRGK